MTNPAPKPLTTQERLLVLQAIRDFGKPPKVSWAGLINFISLDHALRNNMLPMLQQKGRIQLDVEKEEQ